MCRYPTTKWGSREKKNRHLLEVARSLLFQMIVPKTYWEEAILTTTFLINRMPSRVIDFKSPVDVLLKFFPNFKDIETLPPKIFGCVSFIHIPKQSRDKHDPRALRCVFLGYSSNQKGCKCYHPPTKRSHITMDVTFFESQPYFTHTYLQGEIRGMKAVGNFSYEW